MLGCLILAAAAPAAATPQASQAQVTRHDCGADAAEVRYVQSPARMSRIVSIAINGKALSRKSVSTVNKFAQGGQIFRLNWLACPDKREDGLFTFELVVAYPPTGEYRIGYFGLKRDGSLVKLPAQPGSLGGNEPIF